MCPQPLPTSQPCTCKAAWHSLPVEMWDFPTILSVLELFRLVLPQWQDGESSTASQRMPIIPGIPKCLLSLHQTLDIPSISPLFLYSHSAGRQLGEVWGCDNQSTVLPFRAETPCGSAQCCQPHPFGLQRWVGWAGEALGTLGLGTPCPCSPLCPWVGGLLAMFGLMGPSLQLLLHSRR